MNTTPGISSEEEDALCAKEERERAANERKKEVFEKTEAERFVTHVVAVAEGFRLRDLVMAGGSPEEVERQHARLFAALDRVDAAQARLTKALIAWAG